MSIKTKLIIGALFLVQIGILIWSIFDYESNKSPFEKRLELYLENPESVKELYLQGFELTSLPDEILQFENVESINLSHNNFEKIPDILYKLPNLKRLNMSYNNLENIYLQTFQSLVHINLSYNKITHFGRYSTNQQLKHIDLSHNQLASFPIIKFEMDTVNVSHNNLFNTHTIGIKISNTIQHLDLSNNNLYDFKSAKPIMEWCYSVDMSNNITLNGSAVSSTLFSEDFRVKKLFLNNCNFDYIEELPASQLEVLDLGNNNLNITDELVHQLKLKSLNLKNQKLMNFTYFNLNLKELNLVDVLYDGDLNAPNLEILHISNKNIANLPDFPNLKTIYFYMMDNDKIDEIVFQLKYPTADIQYRIINKTY